MKKVILSVALSFMLLGCSSASLDSNQKRDILVANQASKTLEIECATGCSIKYKDPRDQVTLPKESNGYDVANNFISTIGGVATSTVPFLAIGAVAVKGIDSAGGNGSNNVTTDNTHAPTVVESTKETVQVVNPTIVETTKETIQVVNPVVVEPTIVNTTPVVP